MMLAALTASAKYQLDLTNLANGWGSSYDAATQTITYEAGAWGGRGWGFMDWSEADGVTNFLDYSAYDYAVIRIEPSTLKANMAVEYSDGKTLSTDGPWLAAIANVFNAIEPGGTIMAVKLDHSQPYLFQIYIQNQTWQAETPNNPAGTIKILDAFLGTEAEYEEAKNAQGPVVVTTKALGNPAAKGWNDGTVFDAATKTITIGPDWDGIGWWLAVWDNDLSANVGADYSAYDNLVFEFAEPTSANGKITVEYDGADATSVEFYANSTVAVLDLNPEGKGKVMQAYIQGPEGAKFVLNSVYFCTADLAPEVPTTPMGAPVAIWEGSNNLGVDWDWEATLLIAADKFAGATEGSFLELTFDENANADYWQIAMNAEGLTTDLTSNAADLNDYGVADMSAGATSYKIRLNAQDAADLAQNGLRISGYGLTLTKVTLTNPLATEVWTIAGGSNLMGSNWDTTDTSNDLTTTDGKIYMLVKEGVTLEQGVTYEFKVAKDHAWTEAYPGGNAQMTVAETGVYTVTFTFDAETKDVTTNAVKTGEAGAIDKVYSVIGTLNGNWDADSNLTKDADGLYKVTISNVAAGNYEFKIRVNGDWGENYGADGVPGGGNIAVAVAEDGSAVVVTFDADSKTITVTVLTGADGIKDVKAAANNGAAYNLGGRQVKAGKGLYIQNGKKYMAK